ncbi:Crp/Fnr family transcriptional regulator [Phormidium sp. FACHB-592]|uniref:Crp/Fnr family transcriptional regulator n=1 Tax=Stenomitos frigidus AS-A4 TaxID=2933935 RepID=A0ABV0KMF7_9CYAN|nr:MULTISPECIES: Crp/Fnr family transcriptional regulator [Cyanophyceae]MBD2033655.1 Crp/Fnr family transcriptional regulator [Leptolyngbya sp. FACHB-321]MBD2072787.1 Crp/Fnr family transcriptional regulator [Phormidium sp. FACHB-592]
MSISLLYPTQLSDVTQTFSPRSLLPLRQQSIWKIEAGVVRTITWLEDGTIAATGLWGPGDLVGKALSKMESYQIECLTTVEVSLLPVSRLYEETEALISNLQQSEAFSLIRSYRKIDAMVLKLLSWLAKKFGREVEAGHLIDLRLTHQDLAEMLGTTRVTITRTLSQFEQQGLIDRLPLRRIVLKESDFWHYEI